MQEWPGVDARSVAEEMLANPLSPHWQHCLAFVQQLLSKMNVPIGSEDDIAQLVVLSVKTKLAEFRHDCSLQGWIKIITVNKARDQLRRYIRQKERLQSIDAANEEEQGEGFEIREPYSVEEQYLYREQLREIVTELQTFVAGHVHHSRNEMILRLVLFEGYTCDEVAQRLKIQRPVVHVVVRSARQHLRKLFRI